MGVFERRRKLFDVASQKYRVCARTRRGSNTRVHSWGEIVSKKKKKSLAVGVSFSELLLRVFFVVSSERFLKGTFTLLKRCSRGLLGETRGKNARYLDTLRYLRRTQRVRWRTCFALNRLRGVDHPDIFDTHIVTKLNGNYVKFFYDVNAESRSAVKRSGVQLRDAFEIEDFNTMSTLSWALEKCSERKEQFCEQMAEKGNIELLKFLRVKGCPWDEKTCSEACQIWSPRVFEIRARKRMWLE